MTSGKSILFIIIAVLVLFAAGFIFTAEVENYEPVEDVGVSIESEFDNKIVYTTDSLADTGPLVEHCESKGGIFNACGSICGPTAEMCASVCAFTCELDTN